MELGKQVAIFDWEWARERQKISLAYIFIVNSYYFS